MSVAGHGGPDPARGIRPAVPLDQPDRCELLALVDEDPYVNAVVAARLRSTSSLRPAALGGTVVGVRDRGGRLRAAALSAGNLQPIGGGPREWAALADHLVAQPRVCSSIVGRAEAVTTMWQVLGAAWGVPRAVRVAQPLLTISRGDAVPPGDARVRPIRTADLERYLPASVAMFTEELGVSPVQSAGAAADYRRRVAGLIAAGRAFGILDEAGSVVFKADLGTVSAHTCQIQGVWVRPDVRGRGLATAAMARVLRHALELAPTASLYVNDFNTPARRLYARLGMTEVAVLSTVLF